MSDAPQEDQKTGNGWSCLGTKLAERVYGFPSDIISTGALQCPGHVGHNRLATFTRAGQNGDGVVIFQRVSLRQGFEQGREQLVRRRLDGRDDFHGALAQTNTLEYDHAISILAGAGEGREAIVPYMT